MKRSIALIVAGSITAVVGITGMVLILSTVISPTQASEGSSSPPTTEVDIEATAQAIQLQNRQQAIEATLQEREAVLQGQIEQSQQAIAELDQVSQAQINQLQLQLADLHGQIEQSTANLQAMQLHAAELQQAIETDAVTYQTELENMQNSMGGAEQQLQQQAEVTYSQLQSAYNEIAAQQALAAAAPPANPGGDSGRGGGNSSHEKDDHDDSHDDDDHDDDHEDHDDD